MKQLIKAAVCLAFAASVWAQDSTRCAQRNAAVNVRDKRGGLIAGLQPTSFRASISHTPVKISSARVTASVPRILLLLDQSGSVNHSNHGWEAAVAVAGDFARSNSGLFRLALVLFSDHVMDTVNFDRSPNDVLQELANLQGGRGPTALYDSLMYAASVFRNPEPGDAVYVVTDGGDNRSKLHSRDVEREFLSHGIRLFSFVLSPHSVPTEEEQDGRSELLYLAEATGGMFVGYDWSPKKLQHAYDVMAHFYELQLEIPASLAKTSSWSLQVVDDSGRRLNSVDVSYPRSLTPCVSASPQN